MGLEGTQLNLNREQREAKEALEAEVTELKAAQETESTDDGATQLAEKEAALAALLSSFEVRFSFLELLLTHTGLTPNCLPRLPSLNASPNEDRLDEC